MHLRASSPSAWGRTMNEWALQYYTEHGWWSAPEPLHTHRHVSNGFSNGAAATAGGIVRFPLMILSPLTCTFVSEAGWAFFFFFFFCSITHSHSHIQTHIERGSLTFALPVSYSAVDEE